jgi:hypothetical protein
MSSRNLAQASGLSNTSFILVTTQLHNQDGILLCMFCNGIQALNPHVRNHIPTSSIQKCSCSLLQLTGSNAFPTIPITTSCGTLFPTVYTKFCRYLSALSALFVLSHIHWNIFDAYQPFIARSPNTHVDLTTCQASETLSAAIAQILVALISLATLLEAATHHKIHPTIAQAGHQTAAQAKVHHATLGIDSNASETQSVHNSGNAPTKLFKVLATHPIQSSSNSYLARLDKSEPHSSYQTHLSHCDIGVVRYFNDTFAT